MRFVVTGTPRSATGYAALLFRDMAIACTHERVFKPRGALIDILDWYDSASSGESSWLAWAFLGVLPGRVPVLHTVRDPWKVVDSLAHPNNILPKRASLDRNKQQFRECIRRYCPAVFDYDGDIDRAAALVVHWNARIEEAVERFDCPYTRYRVEDISESTVSGLLEAVDVYRDDAEIRGALERIPNNVNAGQTLQYNLEVVHPEIRDALKKAAPNVRPIVDVAITDEKPLSPDELEARMAPELVEQLNTLAAEYGYSRGGETLSLVKENPDGSEYCREAI